MCHGQISQRGEPSTITLHIRKVSGRQEKSLHAWKLPDERGGLRGKAELQEPGLPPAPSTEPTRSVFGFTSLGCAERTSKSLSGELTSPLVSEGSEEMWLQRRQSCLRPVGELVWLSPCSEGKEKQNKDLLNT